MVRITELAIVSIVLAVAAILGFLYLKNMVKTGQEVQKFRQILQDLETMFIYLKFAKYHVCFRIIKIAFDSFVDFCCVSNLISLESERRTFDSFVDFC